MAADHKIRRSTGRNLLHEGNRWVADVFSWVTEFGQEELACRLGFTVRAVWADWAHFAKVRKREDQASVLVLAQQVAAEIDAVRAEKALESLALPLPGLAVVVNPSRTPPKFA